MLAAEYLQAFPRNLTQQQIHRGVELPVVRAEQNYSYLCGQVLHDALSGNQDAIPRLMLAIQQHEQTSFFDVEEQLLEDVSTWTAHRNEVNFHCLNEQMGDLWAPIILGDWPRGTDRTAKLDIAMNSLAMMGLGYYSIRSNFVKTHGTERLYEDDTGFLDSFNGFMQEIDAAIVVASAIRRYPGLTVVPAPMQFESRSRGANANLIVMDCKERRAVGVQVTTSTRRSTVERYDPDRTVIVDGSVDLDNIRVVRVKSGTSKEAIKPWPGIVAASRINAIKLHGRHDRVPTQYAPRLIGLKFMARALVGSLRVEPNELAKRIGDRILAKL